MLQFPGKNWHLYQLTIHVEDMKDKKKKKPPKKEVRFLLYSNFKQ